jgi:transcriptional regulator with XRE-family HTH domain
MNRLKEVLEEKGITQTWLAGKLGKSYNRLEVLADIAKILDVDIKDLIVSTK